MILLSQIFTFFVSHGETEACLISYRYLIFIYGHVRGAGIISTPQHLVLLQIYRGLYFGLHNKGTDLISGFAHWFELSQSNMEAALLDHVDSLTMRCIPCDSVYNSWSHSRPIHLHLIRSRRTFDNRVMYTSVKKVTKNVPSTSLQITHVQLIGCVEKLSAVPTCWRDPIVENIRSASGSVQPFSCCLCPQARIAPLVVVCTFTAGYHDPFVAWRVIAIN